MFVWKDQKELIKEAGVGPFLKSFNFDGVSLRYFNGKYVCKRGQSFSDLWYTQAVKLIFFDKKLFHNVNSDY